MQYKENAGFFNKRLINDNYSKNKQLVVSKLMLREINLKSFDVAHSRLSF